MNPIFKKRLKRKRIVEGKKEFLRNWLRHLKKPRIEVAGFKAGEISSTPYDKTPSSWIWGRLLLAILSGLIILTVMYFFLK